MKRKERKRSGHRASLSCLSSQHNDGRIYGLMGRERPTEEAKGRLELRRRGTARDEEGGEGAE